MSKKRKPPSPKSKTAKDEGIVGEASPMTSDKKGEARLDMANAAAGDIAGEAAVAPLAHTDHGPRLQSLFNVAQAYGNRSFDNYARVRSLAETLRDELCAWLSEEPDCVFLVPPEGRFSSKNYQSAAFSVAGKGYLPLQPISFGLAVRVSEDNDFMRLKMSCRKEGGTMFVRIENGVEVDIAQPVAKGDLVPLFEAIHAHITNFFQDRIDDYDNGRYGTQDIGFDLQRMGG